MTCITAAIKDGVCAMAADSLAGGGGLCHACKTPKIIKKSAATNGGSVPILIGYTSSFRMGDILRYVWEVPDFEGGVNDWLVRRCIPSLRETFTDQGFMSQDAGRDVGGDFIIVADNRILLLQDDFSVIEPQEGYLSVGSGSLVATGAMWLESARSGSTAQSIVMAGVGAAKAHTPDVGGDFVVEVYGN